MRRYETIFIAHPSLSQEDRQPLIDKLTNLISDAQGFVVRLDEWGQRKLAYEINKETRGYYILLEFCGEGSLVKELERNLRLDDRALKYMTVCLSREIDVEGLKAEIEAAKVAEEEALQRDLAQGVAEAGAEEEKATMEATSESGGSTEASGEMLEASVEEGIANGSV